MAGNRVEMRHPEKHWAGESRSEENRVARKSSVAHLHHEGLMDMKPILNRGTGKRLNGIEWV